MQIKALDVMGDASGSQQRIFQLGLRAAQLFAYR